MRIVLWFLILTLSANAAANPEEVVGYWASDSSIMKISQDGDTLVSVVSALLNPRYLDEENTGRTGEVRTDDNNPEESLQSRAILGISIFSEQIYDDGVWQGKIYDPESGNTYQSRITVNRQGNLEIRGYIGMPMFGRTAEFTPLTSCSEAIKAMLPQLPVESPCAAQQKP